MARRSRRSYPLIGITCEAVSHNERTFKTFDYVCDSRYADAVKDAGGHPVLLPIAYRKTILRRYLEGIDGLVIVGGDDVDPRLYGQEPEAKTTVIYQARTNFESWLYQAGKTRALPILAICYGMQLINVLEGGSLYQDIQHRPHAPRVDHRGKRNKSHAIRIIPNTALAASSRMAHATIATEHHQAICDLAPGFIPAAVAADGIIEAIENPDLPQIQAVQWHPERRRTSVLTRRLFRRLVEQAAEFQQRRGT